MELVQIKGNTWCLEGAGLIGVYRLDKRRCILLDSGWVGEREELHEAIEREDLIPMGAIGTHAHRDHIGNHNWLNKTYGTKTCLSAGEAAIAVSPVMCKALYNTLSLNAVMAQLGSDFLFRADQVVEPGEHVIEFLGVPFRIHHTPGHSADHICIGTPDGVCHVGDLVLSERVVLTAQMPYHQVQSMARTSMKSMCDVTGYSHYIISHREVVEDLAAVVDLNLARMDWVAERFLAVIENPVTWNEIMEEMRRYNRLKSTNVLKLAAYENYMRSYTDALRDLGKITVYYDEVGTRHFKRI